MSAGRPSETQAPFGYTFDNSNTPASTSSYPPPGPPLLDNNELGYLESFFEDPSTVDSNLPSFAGEFQGDAANIFHNTSVEWVPQSLANLSTNTMSVPPDVGQISQPESRRQIPASADVYAAAGILHSNTMRQQDPSPYNTYQVGFGSAGPESNQINGYGYGAMPNGPSAEYDFGHTNNGFYSGYDAQEVPNPYMAGLQNRLPAWNGGRPSGPLNFGSDDNFRNSNYTAQAGEPLDKQLVEAVNHNFGRESHSAKSRNKARLSAHGAVRKRGKQPGIGEEAALDIDEVESTSDEGAKQKRRRKSRVKEEDGDDNFGERSGKSKKSKKIQSSSAPMAKTSADEEVPGSSPISKNKRAPTAAAAAAAAAAKERRENLTEEQKRSNHIQSEQKRRNLIKQGFEDLNRMVPELRSSGQSKSNMLVQAARFMRQLRDDNDELRAQMESLDNG